MFRAVGASIITADMFKPVVDGITEVMPIAVGVGAGILAVTFVAKKGFSIVKSFMNKG